jgi:hypothetical protein
MFVQAAHGTAIGSPRPQGALRICLINKDFTRDARTMIETGRSFAVASIMRLTGPGVDATEGTILGVASVDELGDGRLNRARRYI